MKKSAIAAVLLCAAWARAQEGNQKAERLGRASPDAQRAMHYLDERVRAMSAGTLARATAEILAEPAPTFMQRLATAAAREQARAALIAAGLVDAKVTVAELFPPLADARRAPQPFIAAPAQAVGKHHAYPGGLAEHTAFNLQLALALAAAYADRYQMRAIDRDLVTAAAIFHDAMKCWCLQWRADGTLTVQPAVAGTASHHPYAVAEALHRRLPPDFVVALASAHDPPSGDGAARVVGYLRAGAILAGVDPIAYGLVARDGDGFKLARPFTVEAVINHLSDHDYVLTDPAATVVTAALEKWVRKLAPGAIDDARVRWAIVRIESKLAGPRLYAAWSRGGDDALRAEVDGAQVPWSAPED